MTDGIDWLRMPDGRRPTVIIPVVPPSEVGGFRFARVDDGINEDGSPHYLEERGRIEDPAERERLLGYLDGGTVVLLSDWYDADRIDPTRQFAVRKAYRTDGVWVWNAAVEYYLRWHQVSPEPVFRGWITEHGYQPAAVADEVVARALVATNERLETLRRMVAEYEAEHLKPVVTPFPADVRGALEGMGWVPGRDVSHRVSGWLARWVDDLAELRLEDDGYLPYGPIPAALAVLNEFGGLASLANGPGVTSAQIPFTIFPTGGADDLMQFVFEAAMLSERIGARVFQVGEVERTMGALVVDEQGRVFASGPVDLYLGKDIHEALTRMLQGVRAEQLSEIGL